MPIIFVYQPSNKLLSPEVRELGAGGKPAWVRIIYRHVSVKCKPVFRKAWTAFALTTAQGSFCFGCYYSPCSATTELTYLSIEKMCDSRY